MESNDLETGKPFKGENDQIISGESHLNNTFESAKKEV